MVVNYYLHEDPCINAHARVVNVCTRYETCTHPLKICNICNIFITTDAYMILLLNMNICNIPYIWYHNYTRIYSLWYHVWYHYCTHLSLLLYKVSVLWLSPILIVEWFRHKFLSIWWCIVWEGVRNTQGSRK